MENPLQAYIDEILFEAIERGMAPPLVLDAAFANGTTIKVRYDQDGETLKPQLLAENVVDGGDDFPIAATLTDANAEIARFTIDRSGPTFID